MKDITSLIEKAFTQNVLWRNNIFYEILEGFVSNQIKVSFWEEEELWAQIFYNETIAGYMYVKYPIVLLTKEYYESLNVCLNRYDYISVIKVDSFFKEYLFIKEDVLKEVFNVTFGGKLISVEDLWFYTNSV
jgi:hypothetical protein